MIHCINAADATLQSSITMHAYRETTYVQACSHALSPALSRPRPIATMRPPRTTRAPRTGAEGAPLRPPTRHPRLPTRTSPPAVSELADDLSSTRPCPEDNKRARVTCILKFSDFAASDVHFRARDAPDLQVQQRGRSLRDVSHVTSKYGARRVEPPLRLGHSNLPQNSTTHSLEN